MIIAIATALRRLLTSEPFVAGGARTA